MASLILVAYEVRQNTKATRGVTLQAIADQSLLVTMAGVQHPDFRIAYQRASRGVKYATPSDANILMWWYSGVMRVMENRYRQVKLGLVDKSAMTQFGGTSGAYRHPFFRAYWESQRSTFTPDFVAFVEANLLTLTQDSLYLRIGAEPEVRASWESTDSAGTK
jgi:hypothetical protein